MFYSQAQCVCDSLNGRQSHLLHSSNNMWRAPISSHHHADDQNRFLNINSFGYIGPLAENQMFPHTCSSPSSIFTPGSQCLYFLWPSLLPRKLWWFIFVGCPHQNSFYLCFEPCSCAMAFSPITAIASNCVHSLKTGWWWWLSRQSPRPATFGPACWWWKSQSSLASGSLLALAGLPDDVWCLCFGPCEPPDSLWGSALWGLLFEAGGSQSQRVWRQQGALPKVVQISPSSHLS